MALLQMLRNLGRTKAEQDAQIRQYDKRPVEVRIRRPLTVSTLDDMREAMKIISREKEMMGGESFEDFYDFGDDDVDDFEALPAPAQSRHVSVMAAIKRDFDAEVNAAKEKAKLDAVERERVQREALKAEIRAEMGLDGK